MVTVKVTDVKQKSVDEEDTELNSIENLHNEIDQSDIAECPNCGHPGLDMCAHGCCVFCDECKYTESKSPPPSPNPENVDYPSSE